MKKGNQHEQADVLLDQVARRGLQTPALHQLQVERFVEKGQFGDAAGVVGAYWEKDPNNYQTGLALAGLLGRQNKLAEAGALLDDIEKRSPEALFDVQSARVSLLLQGGKQNEALGLCDELVNRYSDVAAYFLRARVLLFSLGEVERAEADVDQGLALDPNQAPLWEMKSRISMSKGERPEAVAEIEKALALDGGNIEIQKRAIEIYLVSGEPARRDQANSLLENALKTSPTDSRLLLSRVLVLQREGTAESLDEAKAILRRLTNDAPENLQAWVTWGDLLLRQGVAQGSQRDAALREAMDVVIRGLAHHPSSIELLKVKARTELMRVPTLAVSTLRGVLKLDPNDTQAVMLLAGALRASGKSDEAVDLLETNRDRCPPGLEQDYRIELITALTENGDSAEVEAESVAFRERYPDDPRPIMFRIRRLLRDERIPEIETTIFEWMEQHPGDTQTPDTVATSLTQLTENAGNALAEKILRNTLERNPDSSPTLQSLAQLLLIAGRGAEAQTLYEHMIELDPNNVVAINNLAWILSEDGRTLQRAREIAEKGLALTDDNADLLDTHGTICFRLGRYNEAIDSLTKSVRLYSQFPQEPPASIPSRYYLAKSLIAVGRPGEARDYLERCLDMNERIDGGLSEEQKKDAIAILNKMASGG